MDDFEHRLRAFQPVGPPLALRDRVVDASTDGATLVRDWLPVMAAVLFASMFYWLAAQEHHLIAARLPAPPETESVDLSETGP